MLGLNWEADDGAGGFSADELDAVVPKPAPEYSPLVADDYFSLSYLFNH